MRADVAEMTHAQDLRSLLVHAYITQASQSSPRLTVAREGLGCRCVEYIIGAVACKHCTRGAHLNGVAQSCTRTMKIYLAWSIQLMLSFGLSMRLTNEMLL